MIDWNLVDEQAVQSGTFTMGGGNDPVPAGVYKGLIDQATLDQPEFASEQFISFRWTILEGDYKGRKVFQKLRIYDPDQKKRAKAINMLAVMDGNCGGGVRAAGGQVDDAILMSVFVDKIMYFGVEVWKLDGKEGNWVNSVSRNPATAPAQPSKHVPAQPVRVVTSDDVPF